MTKIVPQTSKLRSDPPKSVSDLWKWHKSGKNCPKSYVKLPDSWNPVKLTQNCSQTFQICLRPVKMTKNDPQTFQICIRPVKNDEISEIWTQTVTCLRSKNTQNWHKSSKISSLPWNWLEISEIVEIWTQTTTNLHDKNTWNWHPNLNVNRYQLAW